jgi:hypothetical protein
MAWYAVAASDGTLVSVGTVLADPAYYTAHNLTVITLSGDPAGQVWDVGSRTFQPAVPPPNTYPKLVWIQRFTAGEFTALRNSTDSNVMFLLYQVDSADTVTPQDTVVQAGLSYAVSIGLLTSARAALIGAN